MRYSIVLAAVFLSTIATSAQNIVRNWDFSTICSCGLVSTTIGSTSEFFDGWRPHVAKNGIRNVPRGGVTIHAPSYSQFRFGVNGCPHPYSGTGYLSLAFSVKPEYVNFLQNQSELSMHINSLLQTLQKDTAYCVEMHVRAWNGKLTGYYSCETHDKLGVYFTDQDSLPSPFPWQDGIAPQVWNNTGYIDNLDHWRPVRGSFKANGGEQFMYIGNFSPFSSPRLQHTVRTQFGDTCNTAGIGQILVDAVMVYNCRDTVFGITLPDTTVCYGTPVTLHPLVAGFKLEDTVRTYTWHTPMGTFANTDTFFTATQPGNYTLEVLINKRFKATQTIAVKWMLPEPDTALLPQTLPWCRDEKVLLHVPYIDSATYRWNNGSTDTLTFAERPGYYSVEITHPCWQHTTGVEVVPQNCEDLWVPNAFTPDGDGTNDFFEVRGLHETNGIPISLLVLDRWGNTVYQSNNYQNTWDGTNQGQPLQAGVYTYRIIYYKVAGGRDYLKQGTVTLIR